MNRILTVVALVGAMASGVAAQPVQPLHGEEIAAIWKERQDKVKTARFEFTRDHFEPKGGLNKLNPYLISLWSKSHPEINFETFPATDLRLRSKSSLLLDGAKVRFDYQSEQFDFGKRDWRLRQEQTAFDGSHFRSISETKDGSNEGAVSKAASYPEANMVAISAVLTSVRGRTKGLTTITDVRTVIHTGRRAPIDGIECLEYLVGKMPDGSHSSHVWLAPALGWQIIRDIGVSHKVDVIQKREIRYKPDPIVGWVPATWEYARIQKGEVLLQSRFSLDSYSLNDPIAAVEFALNFPKGMNVMDEDAKGGAVVGAVGDNGRITPDDGRPSYYLPGNEPSLWYKYARYFFYALIVPTVAALAWRMNRMVRRSRASQVPPAPSHSTGEVS